VDIDKPKRGEMIGTDPNVVGHHLCKHQSGSDVGGRAHAQDHRVDNEVAICDASGIVRLLLARGADAVDPLLLSERRDQPVPDAASWFYFTI
jgi:hypothetical protein